MSESDEFNTSYIVKQAPKIQARDPAAVNDLICRAQRRLKKLAGKMLQGFPKVGRWEGIDDVLQNATIRLLRALETTCPQNTRAFFGLAAEQIRRELIDLTRHYQGPLGSGAHHDSVLCQPDGETVLDPAEALSDDLERWRAFHEAVEELPAMEREVFSLTYYHGWTQAKIAELFGRDERTIRRYWQSACEMLRRRLGHHPAARSGDTAGD